jgi:hypothetical protein
MTEEGEEIVKASVFLMKKRNRDDSVFSLVEKKAKVVATIAGAARQKRIWEVVLRNAKDF